MVCRRTLAERLPDCNSLCEKTHTELRHRSKAGNLLQISNNPWQSVRYQRRELAGGPGFEPGLAESESAVLPLDDPPSRFKVPRASPARWGPGLLRTSMCSAVPVAASRRSVGAVVSGHLTGSWNRNSNRLQDQRFENCGRLRALCSPTFLRSTARASRVRKPALRSGERRFSS